MTTIVHGKVEEVAGKLPANSFDAVLCDPPYALTANKRGGSGVASISETPYGRARIGTGNGPGGFMGKAWDSALPSVETWRAVYGALKPGGMLLAFGGTRTHHRLMCGIEDAGFEIRDCLMWLYGSGFPKSLDISKAIDRAAGAKRKAVGFDATRYRANRIYEGGAIGNIGGTGRQSDRRDNGATITAPATDAARQWSGYGTALKPAWEPIIVAMKPCEGTFAENARKWGVAGLAIDAGRIGVSDAAYIRNCSGDRGHGNNRKRRMEFNQAAGSASAIGRWPANVLLDEAAGEMLDRQSGTLTSGANPTRRHSPKTRNAYGTFEGQPECIAHRGLDTGGASRFFYCAKAGRRERGEGNTHPTVKPLKLAEYLARLVLPPERDTPRRLLVPFSGSGSEIIGALRAGWDEVTGIDMNAEYCRIARRRISLEMSARANAAA